MKTEVLIHNLAQKATPVKRLSAPHIRFIKWLASSMFCLLIGILYHGLNIDVDTVASQPAFDFQLVILVALVISSGFSAFIMSVPGEIKSLIKYFPIGTLGLLLLVILISIYSTNSVSAGSGLSCIRDVVFLGGIPGFLLIFLLRKARPLDFAKVGLFAFISSSAIGALGTNLICENHDPLHILVWHFMPVLVLGGAGIVFGRWLLKKGFF